MDSDAEDEIVGPDGWEDEMARRQDALIAGGEIPLPAEDLNDAPLSTLEVGVAVTVSPPSHWPFLCPNLTLCRTSRKARNRVESSRSRAPSASLRRKKCAQRAVGTYSALRTSSSSLLCHRYLFCITSCITYVLETAEACPTCRQPALATQLRSLDMHIYGCAD
jgi:hypothetical protein